MLTLYAAPNTCSLATAIALEEAGAKYDLVKLDFPAGEQRGAAYLAKNPKGRVPTLATDEGILTETPALLIYVAQAFPKANLAPLDDPFRFAKLQEFNSYLCSTVHPAHAHRMRGNRWTDDPSAIETMKKKVPQNMADCFALIEKNMFKGPWVLGEAYSVADIYLFILAGWMEADSVDPDHFPKIRDHRNRMNERPAVQRAKEKHGG